MEEEIPNIDIPGGPYLYDDPRFVYDEPCLFYDGGFSVTCLINLYGRIPGLPKKVGKGGGYPLTYQPLYKQEEECRTVLDVIITVEKYKLNNKVMPGNEVIKKYHLDYGQITVDLSKIKHEENEVKVYARAITSSIEVPKICVTDTNIKMLPIKTIVSNSLSRIKRTNTIIKTETIKKK
jgi:hypothetical protein